jgi:hypothetical protein
LTARQAEELSGVIIPRLAKIIGPFAADIANGAVISLASIVANCIFINALSTSHSVYKTEG